MGTNHTDVVPGNVRANLARQRLRQADLAAAMGLSQQALSRRLSGDVDFTIKELGRVAEYLNVPLASLLPIEAVSA